ncbi:MAG: 4-hydroxythreonine-4-phosphate dehydrogenase PdxA [Candidatus Puniceispirillales bacterium]
MKPPAVFVTPGEPAGIGAECLIKAVDQGQQNLITMDDPDRLARLAASGGYQLDMTVIDDIAAIPDPVSEPRSHQLMVIPITWPDAIIAGQPSAANAPQVIHAIRDAVTMVQSGLVDALVTNPIQKLTLHDAGFSYPGHTEYLASLDDQNDIHPVMMLVNPVLRVVPLTIHMPLKDIFAHITSEHIIRTVRIMAQSLISDFGIQTPHIAVAGLNPHAGENGMLGNEEQVIIAPAITSLQAEGLDVTGPYSADTLFFDDKHDSYDAVLAMYHDQALIPVKTLDFHHGVNATLGLSFIRTSPDHGTALDQAGQFTARPDSLIAAIELAQFMANQRENSINRQTGLSS